jgi:hypothetical protein
VSIITAFAPTCRPISTCVNFPSTSILWLSNWKIRTKPVTNSSLSPIRN